MSLNDSPETAVRSEARLAQGDGAKRVTRAEELRLALADEIINGSLAPGATLDETAGLRRLITWLQGASNRADGDVGQIDGRLFGTKVRLPNGPFVLALAAGVPIYPLFIARSGYRSYEIIVREPIAVVRSGRAREDDIAEAVAKWCAVLEELLAERWDQWFAFTPLFFVR